MGSAMTAGAQWASAQGSAVLSCKCWLCVRRWACKRSLQGLVIATKGHLHSPSKVACTFDCPAVSTCKCFDVTYRQDWLSQQLSGPYCSAARLFLSAGPIWLVVTGHHVACSDLPNGPGSTLSGICERDPDACAFARMANNQAAVLESYA